LQFKDCISKEAEIMKVSTSLFSVGLLHCITLCVSVQAITLCEPGYCTKTFATYSKPEIGDTRGLVFDSNGNLYATHGRPNGTIWRITPEGEASEFLSGLNTTCGIVWGGDTEYGDYLYVVEYETWGGAIYRIGVDGEISHFASMDQPLHAPTSLDLDKIGNYGGYLYVGTSAIDHIYYVNTNGSVVMFSEFPGWLDGGAPYDIAFDPGTDYGGFMYVATKFSYTPEVSGLFALDYEGHASRFAPELAGAFRAEFDQYGMFGGQLFVIGWTDLEQASALWRVRPDGAAVKFAETTASRGLAFGPDGAMYVAEYSPDDYLMTISMVYREVSSGAYYVDAINGSDLNDGLSPVTAFATIQTGIDSAQDGNTVLVYPGLYTEEINFQGKAITVQGIAGPAGVPVLENPDDLAVLFYSGEGPDSVLKNFVIRNSFMAVFILRSSPTISNVTVVNNEYGIQAYVGSEPDISNSIFWNNVIGDLFRCRASYSCLQEPDQENITADPLFVDTENGDYHLLSERGRYWPEHDVWVLDEVSSPCIDGGDPNSDYSNEPMPNGGRINMGAYGGTPYASMSELP
jgi:hypothetical protein